MSIGHYGICYSNELGMKLLGPGKMICVGGGQILQGCNLGSKFSISFFLRQVLFLLVWAF